MGASGSKWTVDGAEVDVTTPFAAFDGAVTGECVERDGKAWFAISAATGDADVRNVAPLTVGNDFWELHLVDVNVAMGDLLAIVSGHLDGMG